MNYNGSTATALAGHELHELDYGSDGSMLRQIFWTSEPDCQPTGFPKTGGGPPNNPGDNYLISQLDQNNPVVACDPRVDQQDTYQMDGVTNINDPRVVHTQVTYTYDGDDQGVSPYDYGNVSDTSTSGADLGTGVYVDAHNTTYPHDNVNGGIFLTNLPAVSQVRNGSGTPSSCSQSLYGGLSRYDTSPDVPGITQVQTHTVGGTSGCGDSSNQINVLHSYDTSGNLVSSTDGDNHTGCTIGSSSYSACATYDASTYDTHITGTANALNQATSSVYDPGTAGGFGQWLTSMTDVNGQTTTYQYDALGRLIATVEPGDSQSSPTISYTYIMTCNDGVTTPCIELDTSVRYTIGGPTSTTKQWYDGWGRLIETQAPSPNNGQTIVTYTVYYNDGTNGNEVIASMPYAIATPSGYVAPDLTQARSVTKYDGLGRSEGITTYYSGGSNIAMASTITYHVGQGVTGISSDSSTAFEQTTTFDSYNHQSIVYTDALGRTRYTQLFSGTSSYSMVRTVGYAYDILGDITGTNTYDANGNIKASYSATFDAVKRLTGYNDSDLR